MNFLAVRSLGLLLSDPTRHFLDNYINAIDHYHKDIAQNRSKQDLLGMGKEFNQLLQLVKDNPKAHDPHLILVSLLFMSCNVAAHVHLPVTDRHFLADFSSAFGNWCIGRDCQGQLFESKKPERMEDAHSVCFVLYWVEEYRRVYKYAPQAS